MLHNPDLMRHIPEEELHAYLDQALSRSQCVEIEHHLAGCRLCRAERDGIAALRDRTTALLVAASPRQIRPRPYTQISATHVQRISRRAQQLRAAAWAASVIGAVGFGWGLSHWTGAERPAFAKPKAAAPAPTRLPGGPPVPRPPAAATPTRVASAPIQPARGRSGPAPTPRRWRTPPSRPRRARPFPNSPQSAATRPRNRCSTACGGQ